MRRSDVRRATHPARGDRFAVVVGLVVGIAIALASAATLFLIERTHHADLALTTERVTRSIGSAVADTVGRAVGFGIPLRDLYGVEDYLEGIIRRNPEVAAIAITDDSGQTLFSVPQEASGGAPVSVQIPVGTAAVGLIVVTPSQRILDVVARTLAVTVLSASLFGALLAGILARAFAAERIDLRQGRLVASLRSLARGGFGDYSPVGTDSPLHPLGAAFARRLAPVRREARQALALADEIRAVDFDASLGPRVDEALAPIEGKVRFDATHPPGRRRTWKGWWAVPLLLVGTSVHPLVPSFAFDRLDPGLLQSLEVSAAVAAQFLGCALGLLAALKLAGSSPAATVGFGTLLAGATTAATALIRDPTLFLALRFCAGLGLWAALWVVLLQPGFRQRRPWFWSLMVLAGFVGSGLGGLVAEALGRRDAFAVAGLGLVVLGLAVLALVERPRALPRLRLSLRPGELVAVGTAFAVAMTWLELALGTGDIRYNYAELGLHFCLTAVAAAAMFASRRRLAVAPALLLAAAGPALGALAPELSVLASLLVGLGSAMALSSVGERVWAPEGALAAVLGGVVGAAAAAGAAWLDLEPAWAAVAAGLVGAALTAVLMARQPAPVTSVSGAAPARPGA
jgi:MFS family permease